MQNTVPPWAQGSARRWANSSEAVVLSDMGQCVPAGALSPRLKHGRWKVIPYETVDKVAGNMIWASALTDAPEVRLALGAAGWHAIFVGVFSTSEVPSRVWVKLDGDPAAVLRSNDSSHGYGNIADLFFKVARLDGETLVIRQQYPAGASACGVAYVKLVPLSAEEIRAFVADGSDKSTRRMAATNDGFSWMFYHRPTTEESLLSQAELFRGTDFGTLLLHSAGADKVAYRSAHGHNPGLDMDDFPRPGDRNYVESIRQFAAKGINPLRSLIDGAHKAGLKVHVGIRPAGWSFFEPYAEFWETPFYLEHPEWRCVDRDGTPVTRMSWAVPQVRRHLIELLGEMVGFGADGAHIVFNRGFPFVLYEAPFVEMFRKRFRVDPRQIEEADPRITELRADIAACFLRELRAALENERRTRADGKRLEISAMVLGNEEDNLLYGLDLRRLAAESLLDEIYIYPWDFGGNRGEYDFSFFREICTPRRVPFFPSINTGYLAGNELIRQAMSFYEEGAAGITVFDAEAIAEAPDLGRWLDVSRFGHLDEMRARADSCAPEVEYATFHRLGSQIRDGRFGPYWGG